MPWPLRLHVLGCAALCSAGGALGLLVLAEEAALQAGGVTGAIRVLGCGLALGALLGVRLPRRVVRARLPDPDSSAPVEFEFAATLSGVLLILWALTWLLVFGLALSLEAWRTTLCAHLLLPPPVLRIVLLAPLLLGLVLLGAGGTLVLVALHGWHRLVNRDRLRIDRLWAVLLAATAGGAGLAALMRGFSALSAVSLVLLFAAGGLAVATRVQGTSAGESRPTLPPPRSVRRYLVASALAFIAWGSILGGGTAGAGASAAGLGPGLLVVALAALLGIAVARAAVRFWPAAARAAPLLALAMAIVALARCVGASRAPGGTCLILGTATASAVVVLSGRAVARRVGRVQTALAAVGTSVTAGLALGLLVAPVFEPRPPLVPSDENACHEEVRRWLAAGEAHARVAQPASAGRSSALDSDLLGPRWGLLILECDAACVVEPRAAERIVRRCRAGLRPGGRFVLGPSAAGLLPQARAAFGEEARFHVQCSQGAFTASIFGPSGRDWLNARPAPGDWVVSIGPFDIAQ